MKKAILMIAVPLAVIAPLSACKTSPTSASANSAGQIQPVQFGTITAVRGVDIRPGNTRLGAITGAVIGGAVGSTIGGSTVANIAGATAGAVTGGAAGSTVQGASRQQGVEFVIQLDSGETVSLVQPGNARDYRVGDRVRVTGTAENARVDRR